MLVMMMMALIMMLVMKVMVMAIMMMVMRCSALIRRGSSSLISRWWESTLTANVVSKPSVEMYQKRIMRISIKRKM